MPSISFSFRMSTKTDVTRRAALKIMAMALASSAVSPGELFARENVTRPNVLLVIVDDLNTQLGCYGNTLVKTPHIDRLAGRGLLFERAYCQAPICGPTRASMLTGYRPDSTGVYDNYTGFRNRLPDAVTLPRFFKDHGYTTLKFGKVFHGKYNDPEAWSQWKPKARLQLPSKTEKEKALRKSQTPVERMMRWGPTDNADAAEGDGANARRAAQAIEELKDQPFFMTVGFYKPHVPLIAPRKFFDMYSPSDIEVRTGPKVKGNFHGYLRGYAKRDLTDQDAREIVAAYYACTTFMDAQFGLLLDALDRSGQADNTVIVLWGDHGWLLGEHWRWAKHNLYEETCRVPLIVAGPGVAPLGRRSSALVESVDIYPTLAELCGLTPPSGLEGLSMVPLARDPDRAWKKGAFTQHKQKDVLGASVRTGRYRYTEWGGPENAELYDHEVDRNEYRNVATDPSYAAAVGDLHQLLRGGWQAALP